MVRRALVGAMLMLVTVAATWTGSASTSISGCVVRESLLPPPLVWSSTMRTKVPPKWPNARALTRADDPCPSGRAEDSLLQRRSSP